MITVNKSLSASEQIANCFEFIGIPFATDSAVRIFLPQERKVLLSSLPTLCFRRAWTVSEGKIFRLFSLVRDFPSVTSCDKVSCVEHYFMSAWSVCFSRAQTHLAHCRMIVGAQNSVHDHLRDTSLTSPPSMTLLFFLSMTSIVTLTVK